MERDINKIEIEKEAKQILDKFAKALEGIDEEKVDFYVDREEFERKEIAISSANENSKNDFKQKILENAPSNDGDFIIAEKGAWKK